MDEFEDLVTTAEFAAIVRNSASTVRYWRHTGYGPKGARYGRRVLYRRSEIRRWIQEREAAETPAA